MGLSERHQQILAIMDVGVEYSHRTGGRKDKLKRLKDKIII